MFAIRDERRLGRRGDPHGSAAAARARSGARRSRAPRGPWLAQQLLAEVVVDGRVGAAARRAGERDACCARCPSRRTSSSGLAATNVALAAADAEARSTTGTPRAGRRAPRPGRAARGAWTCTSRASTIFSSAPGADPLDRARDRLLVVLGRHRADDLRSARPGAGSSSGSGASRSSPSRARRPLEQLVGRRRRARRARRGQAHVARRGGRARPRGRCSDAGAKPAPVRRRAAVGREGEAADRDRARRRGGAVRRVGDARRAASARHARATLARSARRPRRSQRAHAAERGERRAAAVGLLEAEPRLARRAARRRRRAVGSTRRRSSHRDAPRAPRDRGAARSGRARSALGEQPRAAGRAQARCAAARVRAKRRAGLPARSSVYVSLRPREIAISPVRTISISPNGRTMRLERLDLLVRAGDLDDDRALGDVDDLAAEDLGRSA